MCAISGAYSWRASAALPLAADVERVRDHMWRRGQDGTGFWKSPDERCLFGHRRLAIIDLDDRSRQPFVRGPLTVVFNGEIYNFRQLRQELENSGAAFTSNGDSEVIVALFLRDGPAAFAKLRGMFAIAIYDERDASLTLARDPYGIKPLYVGTVAGQCWFASQVKALRTIPHLSAEPDPAGITGFNLWGSIPEPFTLYRAIRSLPAGHWQRWDDQGPRDAVAYASIPEALTRSRARDATMVESTVADAIRDSVSAHLVADVEVGLFLSAGIDSAALLGTMANLNGPKIKAITIGFEAFRGSSLDEVPLAGKIAQSYAAEHIVEWLDTKDIDDSLESILDAMDQPSIDGVNSWFASRAAHRAGLKVVLSGLGADELLAGYATFNAVPALYRRARWASRLPLLGAVTDWAIRHGLSKFDHRHPKAAGVLRFGGSFEGAYLLRRALLLPTRLDSVLDRDIVEAGLAELRPVDRLRDALHPCPATDTARMMALESTNYLKNQLLRDGDWSSMAHTLELRLPFVDWPTLQRIATVSTNLGNRRGKRALAAVPRPQLPVEVVDRPKSGFATPLNMAIGLGGKLSPAGSRDWARRVALAFSQ